MLSPKRLSRVTGSRAGAILGLSPFATRADVMREMVREAHGLESEFKGNPATEWGNSMEPFIIDLYGLEENKEFFIHPFHTWLGATPDAFTKNRERLAEIKCPFSKKKDEEPVFKTLAEQPHYYAQVQIEMACTGIHECEFIQWAPKGESKETIQFSHEWMSDNIQKLKTFHEEFMSEINNPEHLEPKAHVIENQGVTNRYLAAKAALELAQQELDAAKAELVKIADGKKAYISGLMVYQVEKEGAISYAKAIKDLLPKADLEPYRGKTSSYWVVK